MSLFKRMLERLASRLEERQIIIDGELYLQRYYVAGRMPEALADLWDVDRPKERLGFLPTIYLHRFHRPDAERSLHNHPWFALGVILTGGYLETRMRGNPLVEPHGVFSIQRNMRPGMLQLITPYDFHRVSMLHDDEVWTLFCIGEKQQSWGYWLDEEKRFAHWREVHGDDSNTHNPPSVKSALDELLVQLEATAEKARARLKAK